MGREADASRRADGSVRAQVDFPAYGAAAASRHAAIARKEFWRRVLREELGPRGLDVDGDAAPFALTEAHHAERRARGVSDDNRGPDVQ
jgi:hypothetical protein